jgi:eukaryotic-like serine/threonine-protein kinase
LKEADHLLRTGPLTGTERTGALVMARHTLLGRIDLLRGEKPAAQDNARRAAQAVFEGAPAIVLQEAGLLAVDAGDLSLGREFLERLRRLCASPTGEYVHSALDTVQGATELAGGKPDAAIESQRRSAAYSLTFQSFFRLGQAYCAKHDWPSAIEAYERYLEFKGPILDNVSPGEWVLAHLELARLYEHTGDLTQSMHYYDDFLRLWAQANADLKQVREAKAERAAVALRLPKS